MNNILEINNLSLFIKEGVFKKRIPVLKELSLVIPEKRITSIVSENQEHYFYLQKFLLLEGNTKFLINSGWVKINEFNDNNEKKVVFNYSGHKSSGIDENWISKLMPEHEQSSHIAKQKVGIFLLKKWTKFHSNQADIFGKQHIIELFKDFKIKNPFDFFEKKINELEPANLQKLLLMESILASPKILCLENPLKNLESNTLLERIEILKSLPNKYNLSLLFFTNDIREATLLADEINIMYAGKIIEKGQTNEIINFPQHPYTWSLLLAERNIYIASSKVKNTTYDHSIIEFKGDHFVATRFKTYAQEKDSAITPPKKQLSPTHYAFSWLLSCGSFYYQPPKFIFEKWCKFIKKHNLKFTPGTLDYKKHIKCPKDAINTTKNNVNKIHFNNENQPLFSNLDIEKLILSENFFDLIKDKHIQTEEHNKKIETPNVEVLVDDTKENEGVINSNDNIDNLRLDDLLTKDQKNINEIIVSPNVQEEKVIIIDPEISKKNELVKFDENQNIAEKELIDTLLDNNNKIVPLVKAKKPNSTKIVAKPKTVKKKPLTMLSNKTNNAKRPVGRPRKIWTTAELNRPKRPVGRPRKIWTTAELNRPKRPVGRPKRRSLNE